MSNWRFGIVVVVLIGKPPLMGEVLCSTENSPFLIIDHIHAKMNRVCCAALAIGKKCMNVRKNKLYLNMAAFIVSLPPGFSFYIELEWSSSSALEGTVCKKLSVISPCKP